MKRLTCKDIGVDCDVEFLGETDDEIMMKASEHAKKEHNLPVIPANIEDKCRKAICEADVPGATCAPNEDVNTSSGDDANDTAGGDDDKKENEN